MDIFRCDSGNSSLELDGIYLLVSPLWPKVPWQSCSNAKEGEHHEQPQKPINSVELPVKGIANPVDGAPTCVFLSCLSQRWLLECLRHVFNLQDIVASRSCGIAWWRWSWEWKLSIEGILLSQLGVERNKKPVHFKNLLTLRYFSPSQSDGPLFELTFCFK